MAAGKSTGRIGRKWHKFGTGLDPDLVVDSLSSRCLQPRYFPVVCTEAWPNRNSVRVELAPRLGNRGDPLSALDVGKSLEREV
jgi:hypothetical protein